MTLDTRMEPIELTDDELKAVAGGNQFFVFTNSASPNSFNDNEDSFVIINNSRIINSTTT